MQMHKTNRMRSRRLGFEQLESRRLLTAAPLIDGSNFEYLGAFRLQDGDFGVSRFGYGGQALAINPNDPTDPTDNTLFISGHDWHPGAVAEISIETAVNSENFGDLPRAGVLQDFAYIDEGKLDQVKFGGSVDLGGLLVHENELIWSGYNFYDANGSADRSHGTSSLDLDLAGDAEGMFRVGNLNPGITGGYMAHVPAEWQVSFGVPVLTGQSNLNIITRTSSGPTAVGFDPNELGVQDPVASTNFLYYPSDQPLADSGMGSKNDLFNYNSSVGGMVFPEGTSSVVFFGGHATNEWCYGEAVDCNDPVRGGKGNHDVGGNYVYQAWAYDANDLLEVKNGTRNAWDLEPYATWRPTFPQPSANAVIGGVAYDAETDRVYVVQYQGDRSNRFESKPLIHVYQVNLSPPATPVSQEVVAYDPVSGQWQVAGWDGESATAAVFAQWGPQNGWSNIRSGDWNGDGHTDVAAQLPSGRWYVGLNNGQGAFVAAPAWFWSTSLAREDIFVGDFDGDGAEDLLHRAETGHWYVSRWDGADFVTENWEAWGAHNGWNSTVVGDFTGDGRDDIASRASWGRWYVAVSDGVSFDTSSWTIWSNSIGRVNIMAGDFNGDGLDDLVHQTDAGHWYVSQSNGTSFTNRYFGFWSPGVERLDMQIADFDGNGRDDIIARTTDGHWYVAESDGNAFVTDYYGKWTDVWRFAVAGDFNGDGLADLVGLREDGVWRIGLSDGDQFGAPLTVDGGSGDFDFGSLGDFQ